MRISLPPADHTHLDRSPLKLVVCQARFTPVSDVSDPEFMLALHGDLGGRDGQYPRVERIQTQSMTVRIGQGGGDLPSEQQVGWKFISADGTWTATVMPDYLALETTTGYISWDGCFSERLFELVGVVSERAQPVAEERLGLRYVDQIREPSVQSPQQWQSYVDSSLLGPIMHEKLGQAVTASHQQVDLQIDDETRCVVRHGFSRDQADDSLVYILDTDAFREGVRVFDPEDLKQSASSLRELSNQIFQQCITAELFEYLKGEH